MFYKKIICWLCFICLMPTFAFAAKTYNSNEIHSDDSSTGIVFKAGDKFSSSSKISVEVYYTDLEGIIVDQGKGTIKSVSIDGEKVDEWAIKQKSGSVIQIGNTIYQAAYAFTLMPAYAAADSEGYYSLTPKTYDTYCDDKKGLNKRVKVTGSIVSKENNQYIVSIADEVYIAIETEEEFTLNDNVICKGSIAGHTESKNQIIPVIRCEEVFIQQYEPLKKGDRGSNVLTMKERMQVLGYFKAGAELSDAYNDTCVERVKQFQANNGLSVTGIADVETLALLYSDVAKSK